MSRNSFGRDGSALYPLRFIANLFKKQTLEQLEINMMTQHVWPYAIYPTFPEVNEYRRQQAHNDHSRGWFADGEGYKSFEGTVYEADEKTGMVTMGFKFNDYMQYVDIGVGAGRKSEDVERGKKVRYRSRYASRWNPSAGQTHRPGIRPEINHTLTRLENYVQRYYDAKLDFRVLETFADEPLVLNL